MKTKKDLMHPRVVLNEDLQSQIEKSLGELVKGTTFDERVRFIIGVPEAYRIVGFFEQNPGLLQEVKRLGKLIDNLAPEVV